MSGYDLQSVMKRAVELARPDLRAYYRMPRKGVIMATYASDGSYWADVQPCRNDESVDDNEPVVKRVEIPVAWGGPDRGMVCPPAVGTAVVVGFHDGDPNYPHVMGVRWQGNNAPLVGEDEMIIQQEPGVHIKIDQAHGIITVTPGKIVNECEDNKEETIGGDWTVEVTGKVRITAPSVTIDGNLNVTGSVSVGGNVNAGGQIIDSGGNTNHHSH